MSGACVSQVVSLSPIETGQSNLTVVSAMQRIVREWMPYLSANEFAVLIQLVDRTIGWRKTRATFSLNRVLDGDKAYGGISAMVSRRSLFRALASLEEKGMIARHKHPEGKQIRVYSVNMGWSPMSLNLPKRLRAAAQTSANVAPDQCHSGTGPVPEWHTREGIGGEGSQENVEDAGRPADDTAIAGPEEVIRAAKADVVARRRQPPRKLTTLVQIADASQREWRHALEESHPTGEFSGWSVREIAQIKAKAKRWTGRKIAFHEFIGWCARNWAGVCRVQLKWMTKSPPPKVPSIGFLLSFIEHFEEAWASKALDDWMHEDQRTAYERFVAKGLSHEEALHEMAKSEAIDATRDEVRKAKQEIKIERGVLRREKEALRGQHGNAPIHPRSRLAEMERRAARGPLPEPIKITSEEDLAKIDLTQLAPLPEWKDD